MPKVSLIIPAYNAGEFLDATLRSVSSQTLKDFECIVVDDFSNDETQAIAKKWRLKDRRIQILTQHAQSGVSAARNAGLRMAKAPLIAFLDADDLLMADSLMVRVQAYQSAVGANQDQSYRIAGSYCGSQGILETVEKPIESHPADLPFVGFVVSGGVCPFNCNQPLIRADVLRKLGGFNELVKQAEDYDLWARILRSGYWFVPAPHVAVTYRSRRDSAVRQQPARHLKNSLMLYDSSLLALDDEHLCHSPLRLKKPSWEYSHQSGKLVRILEFCGMEIASSTPPALPEVAKTICKHLPDLPEILGPHQYADELVAGGVKRQLTTPKSHSQKTQIQQLLKLVYEQLAETKEEKKPTQTTSTLFHETTFDRIWSHQKQSEFAFIFLPHKDYHVWTIGLAADAFRRKGIRFAILDISSQWRDAGVRSKAEELGIPLIPYGEFALGRFAPRLLVAFNDWDYVTRPILVAAQEAGIPTAAIVEGIQDYLDEDTSRKRHAYQTVDTVLLPGDFDRRYFEPATEQTTEVVGIPRIQYLRKKAKELAPKSNKVLINSNFSHNVLIEKRDQWLKQAVQAVLNAGMVPVVSRHPEDRGILFPEYVTKLDFYTALQECDASIQRFASGILEALASNVPVVYFNPHGEKVDKFSADSMGAYLIINEPSKLVDALTSLSTWRDEALRRAPTFLDQHAGSIEMDSGESIADALLKAAIPNAPKIALKKFRLNLQIIDKATQSLTRRDNIFFDPKLAVLELKKMAEGHAAGNADTNNSILERGPQAFGKRKTTPLWRVRVILHETLKRLYAVSARFPWLHSRLRRLGEYYIRRFAPF